MGVSFIRVICNCRAGLGGRYMSISRLERPAIKGETEGLFEARTHICMYMYVKIGCLQK